MNLYHLQTMKETSWDSYDAHVIRAPDPGLGCGAESLLAAVRAAVWRRAHK